MNVALAYTVQTYQLFKCVPVANEPFFVLKNRKDFIETPLGRIQKIVKILFNSCVYF